jgi:hypothetical protein
MMVTTNVSVTRQCDVLVVAVVLPKLNVILNVVVFAVPLTLIVLQGIVVPLVCVSMMQEIKRVLQQITAEHVQLGTVVCLVSVFSKHQPPRQTMHVVPQT